MRIKYCFPFFVFMFFYPLIINAAQTKLTLLSGGEDAYRAKVETVLTSVLNGINNNHDKQTPLKSIGRFFDDVPDAKDEEDQDGKDGQIDFFPHHRSLLFFLKNPKN